MYFRVGLSHVGRVEKHQALPRESVYGEAYIHLRVIRTIPVSVFEDQCAGFSAFHGSKSLAAIVFNPKIRKLQSPVAATVHQRRPFARTMGGKISPYAGFDGAVDQYFSLFEQDT